MDREAAAYAVVLCNRLCALLGDPRPGLQSWIDDRDRIARELRDLLVRELRPEHLDVESTPDLLGGAREMWPGLYDTLVQGYRDVPSVKLEEVDAWRCAERDEAESMATVAMIAFLDQHAQERISIEVANAIRCGHCDHKLPVGTSLCTNCGATTVKTERGSRTRLGKMY